MVVELLWSPRLLLIFDTANYCDEQVCIGFDPVAGTWYITYNEDKMNRGCPYTSLNLPVCDQWPKFGSARDGCLLNDNLMMLCLVPSSVVFPQLENFPMYLSLCVSGSTLADAHVKITLEVCYQSISKCKCRIHRGSEARFLSWAPLIKLFCWYLLCTPAIC